MLNKNIPKINALKFSNAFLVLMPVIVPFFLSIGTDMRGIYLLQSVFAVTMFVCEIPSGYISDLIGRKNTLLVSSVLRAIGFSLFPLADSLTVLIIAEVILGVAISLSSGTDTALIYDTLAITDPKKAPIKILGRSMFFSTMGEGFAALVSSTLLLFMFALKDLAIISAMISWLPFFIIATLVEPPRQKMGTVHKENISYIFSSLFKQSRLLNLILLNAIFSFTATLTAVWMFQKYWDKIEIPLAYFGFMWALTNFTASFSSKYAHKVEKKIGSVAIIALIGLLPVFGFLGISFTESVWGVLLCLSFQLCRGFGQVVYNDALNKRVTSDFRATANSILQMGVRILFIGIGPLFGYLIDSRDVFFANRVFGLAYIVIFALLVIPLIRQRQQFIQISKPRPL
tara:strand:+ start:1356 stop:2555 length:1200 start_codon:yes stop_codon:yes gene_type:complete